jgi:hypothetical protein
MDKKESNLNAKCLLKKNWMISVLDLSIVLENPLDALQRGPKFQVFFASKKELQSFNANILLRCKECVRNNTDHFRHPP